MKLLDDVEGVGHHILPTESELNSDKSKTLEDNTMVCELCGMCGPMTTSRYCRNVHNTQFGKRIRSMVMTPEFIEVTPQGVEFGVTESSASSDLVVKDDKGNTFINKPFNTEHWYLCRCVECTHGDYEQSFKSPFENPFHQDEHKVHEGLSLWLETKGIEACPIDEQPIGIDPERFFRMLKHLNKRQLYARPELEYGHPACQRCGFGDYPVTIKDRESGTMPIKKFVKGDPSLHMPYMPKCTKDVLESFDKAFYGLTSKNAHSMLKDSDGHEIITYPDIQMGNSCIGNNGAGTNRRMVHTFGKDPNGKLDCACQKLNIQGFYIPEWDTNPEGKHLALIEEKIKRELNTYPPVHLVQMHYGPDVKEVHFFAEDDNGVKRLRTTHVSDPSTPMSVPWRLETMAGLPVWMQSTLVCEILDTEYRPLGPAPSYHNGLPHVGVPYISEDVIPMRLRTNKKYLDKVESLRKFSENKAKQSPDGLATSYQRNHIFGSHGIDLPDWYTYDLAYKKAKDLGFGDVDKTTSEKVERVKTLVASEVHMHEHMNTHTQPLKSDYCDECNAFYHHTEYFDASQVEGKIEPSYTDRNGVRQVQIDGMDTVEMFNDVPEEQMISFPKMKFDENGMITNLSKYPIAIVGSSKEKHLDFAEDGKVDEVITNIITSAQQKWGKRLVICSGGATGIDSEAERIAKELGVDTRIFRADPQVRNVENVGTWSHDLHKTVAPYTTQAMPRWYDGEWNRELGRIEVGFRTRDERLARFVKQLYCITILPAKGMLHPKINSGPNKGKPMPIQCIHCGQSHYKSAGCWTAIQAKIRGATIETIEIPDGGILRHEAPFGPSRYDGRCNTCNSEWKVGKIIYYSRVDDGTEKGRAIVCDDRDCFVSQGGLPKIVV